MGLEQRQELSHKLVLTNTMKQALNCLQLSAPDLSQYVQEQALSNPLLEVQTPEFYETMPIEQIRPARERSEADPEFRESLPWKIRSGESNAAFDAYLAHQQTFTDYLEEQIGQMRLLDEGMLRLCRYLIGCLDRRGYLDCSLEELAEETGCPAAALEQALFAVQMLDPPGVGARSLSECLILQLAQGSGFNALTLAIARDGLELLSRRDYAALAKLTGASVREVKQAAEEILALNPVPARGFAEAGQTGWIVPDATFRLEEGRLTVELNERILPRLSIQREYADLAEGSADAEAQRYVKEKLGEANTLIRSVGMRSSTLLRVMEYLARVQGAYFRGGELVPVTMQQAAESMELSVSTVSRAVQNKYVQFEGRILPLRSFFTAAVRAGDAEAISSQAVRQRVQYLIRGEDAAAPLSDEAIRLALEKSGISVSRRVIAKYRAALGIPPASKRRGAKKP